MKQFLEKFAICKMFFLVFIFSSCSKNIDLTLSGHSEKLTAAYFEGAGQMHNANLDNILVDLSNERSGVYKSLTSIGSNVVNTEFARSNMLNLANNASIQQTNNDQNLPPQLKNDMVIQTNIIYQDAPIWDNVNLFTLTTSSKFTDFQQSFLSQLNVIISDNDESMNSLLKRISNLEENIYQSSLSQIQQAEIFIITSTAKSSLSYWNQNINKWTIFIDETRVSSKEGLTFDIKGFSIKSNLSKKISWKKVAKSDVGGAVAGVAAWGGAALMGGPVTLAAFGSSVGGWAAGCSAYEAIMQLW